MECLVDKVATNASDELREDIVTGKFELTLKNKEDLVKKAVDCGSVECLKVLIDNGYPVSNGWDSPVKPAAAKGEPIMLLFRSRSIIFWRNGI